ncbi:MAG: amidohydrolase [Planctomycetes bacterium]|nr:amidohydrolase [Planctomycetota bacterium]
MISSSLTRRDFLAASVALGVSQAIGHAAVATPPIVDTHTHFYDPTRPEGIPWPGKDDKRLYRRVLPDDFKKIAQPLGVVGTVIIEASSWVEDNQWLLELAHRDPFVLGIVGNLSPGTPDFPKHVARFSKDKFFRGIRIGSGVLREGLDKPQIVADIKRLADADLELDVNGGPETPSLVASLAAKIPSLRIAINHLGNIKIDGPNLDPDWLAGIRAAAAHKNVFMKVSALVNGATQGGRPLPEDPTFYVPILDAVWNTFGEDRVIYGSDWPVSELIAEYETVLKIPLNYARGRGDRALAKFCRDNGKAAYRWPDR